MPPDPGGCRLETNDLCNSSPFLPLPVATVLSCVGSAGCAGATNAAIVPDCGGSVVSSVISGGPSPKDKDALECFGAPIGRTGRYSAGHIGIIEVDVDTIRPRRYGRYKKGSPRMCPVHNPQWLEVRYLHCVCSEAVALMRSLELANWLRSTNRLPRSTRVTDRNNVFPVVWAPTGNYHVITPLRRFL